MDKQPQVERGGLEPNQEQLLAALRAQGLEGRRVLDIGKIAQIRTRSARAAISSRRAH